MKHNKELDLSIGYISTVQFPSTQTDTEQTIRTIDALWKQSVKIDMIVPRSKALKQIDPEAVISKFYTVDGGFKLRTYPSLPPLPLEAERIVAALIAAFRYGKQYDIIHTRSRGVFILSILRRQPVIFETYRDLPKTAPIFSRLLKLVAHSKYFLGVICHSALSAGALEPLQIDQSKAAVVYNGFDPSLLQPALSKKQARDILNWPATGKTVVYAGNVQHNKGISVLLDLAEALPDARFIIVGGQESHLQALGQQITNRKINNIELAGWKSHNELAPYLYAADVLIIPPTSGPLEKFGRTVLPMKTFLFLGAGRTIIAPATPDICEILEHNVNALLPAPDDFEGAIAALNLALGDESLGDRLGNAAHKKSLDLTWQKRAQRIAKLYHDWFVQIK